MAVSAHASGTQAATVGTEHFLSSVAVAGTFTFHIDTSAMVAGDVVELRVYQKVLTGGTSRVAYFQEYADDQNTDDEIKISVPISNELAEADALRFSLKQRAGTSRSFPWKVLAYG